TLAPVRIHHRQLARAGHRHQVAGGMLHGLQVVEAQGAVGLDRDAVHGGRTRGGTTDVEGTHGQLRTRLADRLRGDDTDGLALVHQVAASQVTAVARGADTILGVAGDGRTHDDGLHALL